MTRALFKLLPLLWLLIIVFLALIRIFPYDTREMDEVESFLAEISSCSAPCLLGIIPGETTYSAALQALEALPWIGEIDSHLCPPNSSYDNLCYDYVQWTMREEHAPFVPLYPDGDVAGSIELWQPTAESEFIVQRITVRTRYHFDDLRLLLGSVPVGSYLYLNINYHPPLIHYALTYNDSASEVRTTISLDYLPCPATWVQYGNWQARIDLSIATNFAEGYIPPHRIMRACP